MMRKTTMRRPAIHGLSFALGVALAFAATRTWAAGAPNPADVVRGFYATLLQTMQQGSTLGARGRYEKLAPAVRQTFDLAFMTRLALGPNWGSVSPAQRQSVTDAFRRYVTATYADRFDGYSGERLEVTGQAPFGADLIVQTRIVKSDGEPVDINYLMRPTGNGWRIADVYLDGSISELAVRRSEFSSILREQGVGGLITALQKKADLLSAAPRASS